MTGRPCYTSGAEVHLGDRVTFDDSEGVVTRVFWKTHSEPTDEASAWFLETYQRGVMIDGPRYGLCLLERPEQDEDLVFVSRRPVETE